MSANIDAVLARLDEMNNGEINYEVYRELHDLVSAIEDDVQAPIELFPGTLDALSIRARTTSPDAATEELERIKPLFENLSREYPNECNKRVKAKAERDAALGALERVRGLIAEWKHEGPSGPFPDRIAIDVGVEVIEPLLAALDGAPEPEVKP